MNSRSTPSTFRRFAPVIEEALRVFPTPVPVECRKPSGVMQPLRYAIKAAQTYGLNTSANLAKLRVFEHGGKAWVGGVLPAKSTQVEPQNEAPLYQITDLHAFKTACSLLGNGAIRPVPRLTVDLSREFNIANWSEIATQEGCAIVPIKNSPGLYEII